MIFEAGKRGKRTHFMSEVGTFTPLVFHFKVQKRLKRSIGR